MSLRLAFGAGCALLVAHQNVPAISIEKAPDLPTGIAERLAPVEGSHWLGNGVRAPWPSGIVQTPHEARQCWSANLYTAQVTYPRTYCVLPSELTTILSKKEAADWTSLVTNPEGLVRLFRFLHSPVKGKYQWLGCVTRSGPWLAEVGHWNNCDGSMQRFIAPFNAFEPRVPGEASAFPAFEWNGTDLPPNFGWATDPVPWSKPMIGGRCPGSSMSSCPGEPPGQQPGQPPKPIVIY